MATKEPTIEELQSRVTLLEQRLLQCMQGVMRVRREDAHAAVAGMAMSGLVFGLIGYLAGNKRGMKTALELTERA